MDRYWAEQFVQEWLEAWNSHDLSAILAHYADDFAMHSPLIQQIAEEASGMLKGKQNVAQYWRKALQMNPDLKFEFIAFFCGVNSLVIQYNGAKGRAVAEVFHFNNDRRVQAAFAHYL
jgi:ketosteroid isomerase-like protein